MEVADLPVTTVAAQMTALTANPPEAQRRFSPGQFHSAPSGVLRYQEQVGTSHVPPQWVVGHPGAEVKEMESVG